MLLKHAWVVAVLAALLLLAPFVAHAQTVTNPTAVQFVISIDHDQLTHYELDIVDQDTDTVIQTLNLGLPVDDDGDTIVTVPINVQPVSFGTYYAVARAHTTDAQSDDSDPSNTWVRQPGRPGGVAMFP